MQYIVTESKQEIKPETKQVTIRLPESVWLEARLKAFHMRIPVSHYMIGLLAKDLGIESPMLDDKEDE